MSDLATDYLGHRESLVQATAAEDLLHRVTSRLKPEGEGKGAAGVPATNPLQDATGAGGGPSRLTRAAKDIGAGVIETPRAIVKGARDAVQSTMNMAGELGGAIEKKLNLPGIKVSGNGIELLSGDELQAERAKEGVTGAIPELPDIDAPKSVTGGMVKSVSQFVVGMLGAKKYLSAVKLPAAVETFAGGYGMAALKAAIANFTAFDPHQERLSNLVQEFPALANPVNEFLASKPDDNAAEGRFKNAVEGFGLGVAADGFLSGLKMLRSVAQTKLAVQGAEEQLAAAGVNALREVPADAFKVMGDEAEEALVKVRPKPQPELKPGPDVTPEQIAAAKKAAGPPESEVFVNYARIDSPEDVQKVLAQMTTASKKNIDAARRGKQTFEEIKLNANERDAWKDLNERRQGEPMNAEQSVAARQLWVGSAQKLAEVAELAATNPSEANLFAFRKMLAVHDTIQTQVISARTETARALASWRIPAGGGAERLAAVMQRLTDTGGADVARQLASRVAALGKAGLTKEMGAVVEKTAYAKTRDAVMEGWINGLLSAPATHVANTTSNAAVMFMRMGERRVAEAISGVLGTHGGVAAGESVAQFHGLTQGLMDMFRYYGKRSKLFLDEDFEGMRAERANAPAVKLGLADANKVEHPPAISSEALRISNTGWLGRAVDMAGQVVRTPGTALGAEDEFFKTAGYRMELNAQALRQASEEVHAGKVAPENLQKRMAEIVANPPENIRMQSADAALYQTFTSAPGDVAQALTKMTSKYPMLKVIMPFVKTPANILKYTFERTPLAPLMSTFRANIAAGGARRDLALGQVATGTGAMLLSADLAMKGGLTGRGPVDNAERQAMAREGWKPYSLKVGDRWYTYNRLDPIGSLLGLSADSVEAMRNAQHESLEDADMEKLVVANAIAFGGNLTNKTYLSGLSDIFEALSDPQRYGEATVQRMVGSVVPAGAAALNRAQDPYVREVNSMLDAIAARTPGLSKDLPARRNVWGEPLTYQSGFGSAVDLFSPVMSKPGVHEPIDEEILRTGANVTMPTKKVGFDGVTVDLGRYPKAYSRYVELAGNELKHPAWKLGAKDLLNQIVTGKHPLSVVYNMRSDGPEGGKDFFIRDMMSKYRDLARTQLMKEYPDLAEEVRAKKAHARAMAMPVIQ